MSTFRRENVTSGKQLLRFDKPSATAWFDYTNASTGRRHQVWIDTPQSVSIKSRYAVENGMHGVAFCELQLTHSLRCPWIYIY